MFFFLHKKRSVIGALFWVINFYENNSQSKKEQAYDHPVLDENDYNGVREYIAERKKIVEISQKNLGGLLMNY